MLETLRLIFDCGLLVLIWMVQLIVYPSFSYFRLENLYVWHTTYTKRIAIIVIPLMFGQLITTGIQVFLKQDFYTLSSSVLVLLVWLSTFAQFVPLHTNIAQEEKTTISIKQLIQKNWIRTLLWTLLFVLTFYLKAIPLLF